MDFTFISDTHNKHNQIDVGSGDILFHTGDATSMGYFHEIQAFAEWFAKQDYKHKVFTPGNHDFGFEKEPAKYYEMFKDLGLHLLIDERVELEGVKIWGSPVTPWFWNWAFNRARNGAEAAMHNVDFIFPHWDMIPNDIEVLLTHGPPYMILDELCYVDGTPKGQFVGCEDLAKRVEEIKPKIHAFGHIHCGHGAVEQNDTLFINGANLDEAYQSGYEPIKVKYVAGAVESYKARSASEYF